MQWGMGCKILFVTKDKYAHTEILFVNTSANLYRQEFRCLQFMTKRRGIKSHSSHTGLILSGDDGGIVGASGYTSFAVNANRALTFHAYPNFYPSS